MAAQKKANLEKKIKRLTDAMDVVSARGKTWKDQPDMAKEEALKSLDKIAEAIEKLREELKK